MDAAVAASNEDDDEDDDVDTNDSMATQCGCYVKLNDPGILQPLRAKSAIHAELSNSSGCTIRILHDLSTGL